MMMTPPEKRMGNYITFEYFWMKQAATKFFPSLFLRQHHLMLSSWMMPKAGRNFITHMGQLVILPAFFGNF